MRRIEIHHHENNVVPRRRHFSIAEDGVVLRAVEAQVIVELEGAIFFSNAIHARDPILDVPRRVPIPFLPLILFRFEIFLAAGQRFVLA